MEIIKGRFGVAGWSRVMEEDFTQEEAKQAADMTDLIQSYGLPKNMLKEFFDDIAMNIGQRLYIAAEAPEEDLGVILLAEEDERIIRIAKKRCGQNTGDNTIILPW